MGTPKDSALSYETALRVSKVVLLVHGTAEEVAYAHNIMQSNGRARSLIDKRPWSLSRRGRWSHER